MTIQNAKFLIFALSFCIFIFAFCMGLFGDWGNYKNLERERDLCKILRKTINC